MAFHCKIDDFLFCVSNISLTKKYLVDQSLVDEFEIELEFVAGEMAISQIVRPLDGVLLRPSDDLRMEIDNFHQTK